MRETHEGRLEANHKFLLDIQALYESDRGKVAALKRNAGNAIAEGRGLSWFHFYLMRHFPERGGRDNNLCLLVAALMTFDRSTMRTGLKDGAPVNFGATLAVLRSPEERATPRPGQTPVERRLVGLLDSTFDDSGGGEMAFRLRQAVKYAMNKQVPSDRGLINWPHLVEDLRGWSHPSKFVQKQWARSFYSVPRPDTLDDGSEP